MHSKNSKKKKTKKNRPYLLTKSKTEYHGYNEFRVHHHLGPAINPVVENSDEPQPSLSDLHDFEPKLEFDDTELLATTITHQSKFYSLIFQHLLKRTYFFYFSYPCHILTSTGVHRFQ